MKRRNEHQPEEDADASDHADIGRDGPRDLEPMNRNAGLDWLKLPLVPPR